MTTQEQTIEPREEQTVEQRDSRSWRAWLFTMLATLAMLSAGCYWAVVLIDPFSTGRFALTQRIDRAPRDTWHWLAKAGIIRDQQFDGAIFGSSVAGPLDPVHIGGIVEHKMLQLALYGVTPQTTIMMSRSFERHRPGKHSLHVFILDQHWCADQIIRDNRRFLWLPEFPTWVYESSNYEYLSRIFYPYAFVTAFRRIGIWFGVREQAVRADGFAPIFPSDIYEQIIPIRLLETKPETEGPLPNAPFPYLDLLTSHLGSLNPRSPVLLVFVPVFVNAIPPAGSAAAVRDAACKARFAQLARRRPKTGLLDLQGDNPLARRIGDYVDALHFRGEVARTVEAEIAEAVVKLRSQAD
jgi:hypothetical protein